MKNLTSRMFTGLAAGAFATATVMAMSAPAQAAGTYTPNGGPGVTFVGHNVAFTADDAGQTLSCDQFDLAGTIIDPGVSRAFGAGGGSLDDLVSSGCTNPIAGATTVTPTGTWGVTITGDEAGSVSPAELTNVAASVDAGGCSFDVAGEVTGSFDDASGVFTPTGSTVVIANDPSGFTCGLLGVAKGQSISVSGTWTGTGLTISNP